jgi:hypothetical protein
MAGNNYIGTTDDEALDFCQNFGGIVDGAPEIYGLTKAITGEYMSALQDYAAKLQAAKSPETRGRRTVFLKNQSKKVLVAQTRKYAQQIRQLVTVTDAQRQALGINIPKRRTTRTNPPIAKMFVKVLGMDGRTVKLRLQTDGTRRGKPANAASATVLAYFGVNPPINAGDWKFIANVTRTTLDVPFPPSTTGDTVWITAFWNNDRGEAGFASQPISISLPAGGALPREAEQPMKLAA